MIHVRDATEADASILLGIYAPHVLDTAVSFETEVPRVDEFAARIARYVAGWSWLVAEVDGQVAGYAYGSPHRERAAYRYLTETTVYVSPQFQRNGIGRQLYPLLFDRLAARGYCNAIAGVTLPNPGSVRLHEAMGFERVGVIHHAGWKFDAWHDVAWFQRRLREGPPPELG